MRIGGNHESAPEAAGSEGGVAGGVPLRRGERLTSRRGGRDFSHAFKNYVRRNLLRAAFLESVFRVDRHERGRRVDGKFLPWQAHRPSYDGKGRPMLTTESQPFGLASGTTGQHPSHVCRKQCPQPDRPCSGPFEEKPHLGFSDLPSGGKPDVVHLRPYETIDDEVCD